MIEVEQLCKRYGPVVAVDRVSFSVKKGEVLGFLGPNGAGKSTTMRMITGYLTPDAGTVRVGGHDLDEDPIAAKSLIGYLPENAPSYFDMTVEAFLRFVAQVRGLDWESRRQAVEQAIRTCHLEPVRQRPIENLSKGYRHRTCFAQAILHDPQVLIMDEPTDGLDPNQKHEMRELIRHMGESKAIVISTHILEEVDAVCSRVAIINQGKLVFDGLPGDLRRRAADAGAVTVTVADKKYETVAELLRSVPGVGKLQHLADGDGGCRLLAAPANDKQRFELAERIAAACHQAGWKLHELHTESGRLDEVFRTLTSGEAEARRQ